MGRSRDGSIGVEEVGGLAAQPFVADLGEGVYEVGLAGFAAAVPTGLVEQLVAPPLDGGLDDGHLLGGGGPEQAGRTVQRPAELELAGGPQPPVAASGSGSAARFTAAHSSRSVDNGFLRAASTRRCSAEGSAVAASAMTAA
jgi:hypothetical protein